MAGETESANKFTGYKYNPVCCSNNQRNIVFAIKLVYILDIIGYLLEAIKFGITWLYLFDEYEGRFTHVCIPV